MARVPHMHNTNMHGKISAKTERLAVNGCYYYILFGLITTHALRIDSECCDMKELEDTLHSFWKLESLGICEKTLTV